MKIPRKIPIIPKYLLLDAKSIAILSTIVVLLVSVIVLAGLHRSLLTEFMIVLGILALSLFLFLFWGLYRGVRLDKKHPVYKKQNGDVSVDVPNSSGNSSNYLSNSGDCGGGDTGGAAPDAAPGIDIGFDLGEFTFILLAGIAVIAAIVFFVIFLPDIIFVIFLGFYWPFYMAYRLVFRYSRRTKGDISKSLLYSIGYTIIYTGWFFILIQAIKYFRH